MNRRGDIEPSLHTFLIVIIAVGVLILLIYVTKSMFKMNLTFSG